MDDWHSLADVPSGSDGPTLVEPGAPSGSAGPVERDAAAGGSATIGSGRDRLATNVAGNVGYFLLSSGVTAWLTPYLIHHLGVEAYGLVPLAASMTAYLSLLTVALNGTVGRFLTMDLARGNAVAGGRTLSTALVGSVALAVALVPLVAAAAFALPHLIHVPRGAERDTTLLLTGAGVAFLIGTVSGVLSAPLFAHKRFDLQNLVGSLALAARTAVIVGLFACSGPRLWQVGLATAVSSVTLLLGSAWTWRAVAPTLRVRLASFQRAQLTALLHMGGWLMVNQLGTILFLGCDLLIVNVVLGATAAGLYASVLQWAVVLRAMAAAVANVLTPTVVTLHAWGQTERVGEAVARACKWLGLAVALPVGLLCGLSRPLLRLWLGPQFEALAPLMWAVIAPLCLNLAILPLFSINVAANKIRIPGMVTLVLGAVNIALACVLAGPAGWGMYGVAAAAAITLTLKNAIFLPVYCASVLGLPARRFLRAIVPSIVATGLVAVASSLVAWAAPVVSWPQFLAMGAVIAAAYYGSVTKLALSSHERDYLAGIFMGRLRRRGRAVGAKEAAW